MSYALRGRSLATLYRYFNNNKNTKIDRDSTNTSETHTLRKFFHKIFFFSKRHWSSKKMRTMWIHCILINTIVYWNIVNSHFLRELKRASCAVSEWSACVVCIFYQNDQWKGTDPWHSEKCRQCPTSVCNPAGIDSTKIQHSETYPVMRITVNFWANERERTEQTQVAR